MDREVTIFEGKDRVLEVAYTHDGESRGRVEIRVLSGEPLTAEEFRLFARTMIHSAMSGGGRVVRTTTVEDE
jgi:hypothetical protein